MSCRLLVLHAPLYTNIVDRKSGPFGGNLDKNAKNWLEQGALAIFWHFLTPGNKWCLDWSWFQTIYPIPIFDILFPFPVTKSQSQWLKSHFPRAKTGQSQFPFYPFRTLEQGALAIFWHFLTPGNKWCLDWSWFQTIYPIPIFDILFPFPVTKSQSQWLKSHFPRAKTGQSQFPFYPFGTLIPWSAAHTCLGQIR